MRVDKFVRSLVFAAVAGLGTIPYLIAAIPLLGIAQATAIGCALAVAAYVAAVSPSAARGLRYGIVALMLCGGLVLFAPPVAAIFGTAMLLGLIRSGVVYGTTIGRALVSETTVFVVSIATARLLAGPTVMSYGLAVWGFFLVQSAYFLFAVAGPRRDTSLGEDPFEQARREATRLMEELPG